MDRKNNLRAFERGVRTMLGQGIAVKVDLIIGLPGDTAASVRRGLHYLRDNGLYHDVQVFNLAVLPGTEFRHEAAALGLKYQPRPPYYVLRTPDLCTEGLYALMQEAEDVFDLEFDALPPPQLDLADEPGVQRVWRVDLDRLGGSARAPERWAQALTLWLRSADFGARAREAAAAIEQVLDGNPFTTLQVVLEPEARQDASAVRRSLGPRTLAELLAACQARPTYLDRYYSFQPGRPNGAKRLVIVLPADLRCQLGDDWALAAEEYATIVDRN
jgi:hypothetical protein